MVIAFAFSFIAILMILGSYKLIRRALPLIIFALISISMCITGVHLLLILKSEEPYMLMPLISPAVALVFLELTRVLFHGLKKQEIIMYLGGFLPKKHEERFVTGADKVATFLIVLIAMAVPYLLVKLLAE